MKIVGDTGLWPKNRVLQRRVLQRSDCISIRERSHITSSAEGGGGGFQKMTLDDGGGGGGVYGQMTSSKIAQFRDFLYLKKLLAVSVYCDNVEI